MLTRSSLAVRTALGPLLVSLLACGDDGRTGPDPDRIGLHLVASGLTHPLALSESPDGTGRLFVAEQVGTVRIVREGVGEFVQPFLDLSARMVPLDPSYDERGLLGFAFHPDYADDGRFYVYYSAPLPAGAPAGYDHVSRISEFRVSTDPNFADPNSERVILEILQPQFNHNGGGLAFGPDGHLYISVGDGGGAGDDDLGHVADWYDANAGGNGQDIEANLLGDILRIDVDGASPYAIPPDNPFVGEPGRDEIWAYGFRNPYRFSIDMGGDGALIVGDAGQQLWEEINVVVRGGNYGWNVREGTHCFDPAEPTNSPATCPQQTPEGIPLRGPVIEYANAGSPGGGLGRAVVGGYIYRGDLLPSLRGFYVFGDWSGSEDASARVWIADPLGGGPWPITDVSFVGREGGELGQYLLGFGQDLDGEIYLLTTDAVGPSGLSGQVWRMVPEVS